MSYYLEILSETSYREFLNQLHGNSSFEEIEEFFDEAVIYDTDFAYGASSDRLLDVINTLRYVKNLCDNGKAKAILGNHDRFILDAAYRPFNETAWWLIIRI